MICASCQHENAPGASFCEECGARLERRCPSCGGPCGPVAKFCPSCGASLAVRPAPPSEEAAGRKVVTILFSDLIGSVSLQERLDPESASRVMERYHRLVRAGVEAHGGTLVQLIGDGVMCAFGVPQVAEDDAIRAVRAAVEVQQAFREFAREESARVGSLGLRVAVNTGEVVPSVDLPAGIGDPLNVAARLQQEAKDGDVVIGEATERVVRDKVTLERMGVFALKGRAGSVAAYRVVSLDRPGGAAATPFVGRELELERLIAIYDAAVAERRARLAVVLGSPGLGKSRLIDELGRRLGDQATVVAAHCDLTRGATFAPIAKALRAHLGLDDAAGTDAARAAIAAAAKGDDAERARIADGVAALLAGTPASPEETFFVIRRFLAALAAERPLLVAIDDLQWAEPLLLDLLEHLIQWTTDVPLLILAAARPELRDTRSSLATTGGFVSEVVMLTGLDAAAATRLAANVIGADHLPAAVAGRVLATSEGNPLFVGELVRMLVTEGALKREGERWTVGVELAKLEMPPTIQALLAARIERLRPEERLVLERAAVIGRQFSRAAVTHLLPREITDLDARLEALRRSELVEPDTGWLLGEPVMRFHHVLIRDAAYRRLLKNTRAELHERFADWLGERAAGAVEHDETIGWHLEQAHRSLADLGPLDDHGRAVGERAARHLAAAGRRALAREDVALAANLIGRALGRLDADDPARADLALEWCEALLAAGEVGEAVRAVDELGRFTDRAPRLKAWHTCFASQLAVFTDPKNLRETATTVAAAAEELAAAGDAAGEAKGHYVHAMALSRLGKVGACEAALDRALAAARRAGDRRRSNAVLSGAPGAALWGPSPVTRASGRCLDVVRVLRITEGAPGVEAVALRCQGVLEALRGRTDAARRMIATSRRMVEELGISQQLLEADVFAGLIELLEGDAAAAERSLRGAYEGLRDQGLGIDAARAAALLGRALLALDRAEEAETLSHECESLAGDDLKAAIAWRGVRAEALARRGEHAAAVELARAAVEIAAATDALLDHADARLALAAALRAAGKVAEAAAEEARAIELWEAKGAALLAERAKRRPRLAPLGGDRAADAKEGEAATAPSISPPHPAPRADLSPTGRGGKRHVRSNAAIENTAALDVTVAAKDLGPFKDLVADDLEYVDHVNHVTYGREEAGRNFEFVIGAQSLVVAHEPLASLGDSLALFRRRVTAFGGVLDRRFDVGPYEHDHFLLVETNSRGKARRVESFSRDRLADSVARLYERYADLLPEGPEQARASATARSVAAWMGPFDADRYAECFAPAIEVVDHRVLGTWSSSGAKEAAEHLRSLFAVADDIIFQDEVLSLQSDALLVRRTNLGRDRATGGAIERQFLSLRLFGADGLMTRNELFESDREAEALARFDELTAEPTRPRPKRRVRPNAATEHVARLDAAVLARDGGVLAGLLREDLEVIHHPTGTVQDRRGMLDTFALAWEADGLVFAHEPLATLGDSLVLCRAAWSFAAWGDVGAANFENIDVAEVDANGRCRRVQGFAADRLGDALARLYEHYAEIVPAGPERDRAAATARTVAVLVGPLWHAPAFARDVKGFDHRPVIGRGRWRASDPEMQRALRVVREVESVTDYAIEDVTAVLPGALLLRARTSGVTGCGGGAYERELLQLYVFGADGLVVRFEQFDPSQADEALARFDELVPRATSPAIKPTRRVHPNAMTEWGVQLSAAVTSRDLDALRRLHADGIRVIHHATGLELDLPQAMDWWRGFFDEDAGGVFQLEPVATLGDSIWLWHRHWAGRASSSGALDAGAFEQDYFDLMQVDAEGRATHIEIFPLDRLGDAVARLYERYAAILPEARERERVAAIARHVGAMLGPFDEERWTAAASPAMEFVDRRTLGTWSARGVEANLRHWRALLEVVNDVSCHIDDVVGLRSDAFLVRHTSSGTTRDGGGAFEITHLLIVCFGADGRYAWVEAYDPNREAEALARFEELTAASPPHPTLRGDLSPKGRGGLRRIRPNAATAGVAVLDAAMAARDVDALRAMTAADCEVIDHPTGATYDGAGNLASRLMLLRADDLRFAHEALATLGDSLGLFRLSLSASGAAGGKFDVGAYQRETLVFSEMAEGHERRAELFATDHLGDALARMYERYAELLPEGAERDRAAATARAVALILRPATRNLRTAYEPRMEFVDHRRLGFPPRYGADEQIRAIRSLGDVASDFTIRIDDVLDLRPNAFLVCWTDSGTMRTSGGAYERQHLNLWTFGPDGLVARNEMFDTDRGAEALARLDELTARPAAGVPTPQRRVRPNAATGNSDRLDTALRDGDVEAISALLAANTSFVDHSTGATYDREGALTNYRLMLRSRDLAFRSETLAVLGDSLALGRFSYSASGLSGSTFDVGAHEGGMIWLAEVDLRGLRTCTEHFAPDRLGDGVVRLYERYAEMVPAGPEGERAAATARSIAAMLGPPDVDRWAAAFDSSVEQVDHQTLGTWSARGAEANLQNLRSFQEVAETTTFRIDDVLAVRPNALLAHWTASGTERSGGGTFEWPYLAVHRFGADGRVVWSEVFDPDRDAEALARFDELTAERPVVSAASSKRSVRPNAATADAARLDAAVEARDAEALETLFADDLHVIDHTTDVRFDRNGGLKSYRALLSARDPKHLLQPLATLGDSLALCRMSLSASGMARGSVDVGPYSKEEVHLIEVDADGRRRVGEVFASNHLGDAVARLYERYADLCPEGPERERAAATARTVAAWFGPFDVARHAPTFAPGIESVDHRLLGTWSARGADEVLRNLHAYVEVAEGITIRIDDVVALQPDALLIHGMTSGTDRSSGGRFERPNLWLIRFGVDGLVTRQEHFDVDREAEALARFDELTTARPPQPRIENAATRASELGERAWNAHDWAGFSAMHSPRLQAVDRRRFPLPDLDRDGYLESLRMHFDLGSSRVRFETLATRGDQLALVRSRWHGADRDVGPSETETVALCEVDEGGQVVTIVNFEPDDLDAAYAELDARWEAGLHPLRRAGLAFVKAFAARDWKALAAVLAPDFTMSDHRAIALLGEFHGPAALIENLKPLVDLAEDVRCVVEHVISSDAGDLIFTTFAGTWQGGAFELPGGIVVSEFDALGRIRRFDNYDHDQIEEARARFAEIRFDPLRVPANAATVALDRHADALKARDWTALDALCAPTVEFDDRRRIVRLEGGRDTLIASSRMVGEAGIRMEKRSLVIAGERLALQHVRWSGEAPEFEAENLSLTEVDAEGRIVAIVSFDPDDRRAASAELLERLARGEGARPGVSRVLELGRAVFARDLDRVRAALPADFFWLDHRRTGAGRLDREGYVGWLSALFEQSPDAYIEAVYEVAASERGSLIVARGLGTLAAGGPFEFVNATLWHFRGGELAGAEVFEIDDLDTARARFDAHGARTTAGGASLCPDVSQPDREPRK